tara:strand:- start:62 stop:664 length:603 start_codon:yes stop_codon:yes gene_type:complete
MEFASKIMLSILLGFLLIFGLVVLILYVDNNDADTETTTTSDNTSSETVETTTPEEDSETTTATAGNRRLPSNQDSPSAEYSSEELDQKTLMLSDDMIYCLKNDATCSQTTEKNCSDNHKKYIGKRFHYIREMCERTRSNVLNRNFCVNASNECVSVDLYTKEEQDNGYDNNNICEDKIGGEKDHYDTKYECENRKTGVY